jgi:general L-amino acid transport system permease protein
VAQWLLLLAVVMVAWYFVSNAADNLARRNMAVDFSYLGSTANFDIPFHLIDWVPANTFGRALLVSLVNTLLVSVLGIVAATLLGLLVGIMRLSENWLVRNIGLAFIELVRNTPILVQIIFWYVAVLQTLPGVRQSIQLPAGMLLNIRGFYLPSPVLAPHGVLLIWTALALLAATPVIWRLKTGQGRRAGARALALPLLAAVLLVCAVERVDTPSLKGFNIAGGIQLPPELVALWAGLSIYAAAFIAEIVRGAILAVHKGQREAAMSLGLRRSQVTFLIVLPQALRMMVPPLTSQYANLIKSSSLGAAVAYPELFQIFAGTVLNQSGREIETIVIVMAVFLGINLAVSAFMNWYNRHVALVER